MIRRREILATGIAVPLLARAAAAADAPGAFLTDRVPTNAFPAADANTASAGRLIFIAADRSPEGVAAARAAVALGAAVLPLGADVTPVYERLDLRLRNGSARIAGLTSPNALFVIERLAWDRGLRTVYRGVHRATPGVRPAHELAGSPGIVERIRSLAPNDWAAGIGRVLADAVPQSADEGQPITAQWLPHRDDPVLVSWLLVPRSTDRHGTQVPHAARTPRTTAATIRA